MTSNWTNFEFKFYRQTKPSFGMFQNPTIFSCMLLWNLLHSWCSLGFRKIKMWCLQTLSYFRLPWNLPQFFSAKFYLAFGVGVGIPFPSRSLLPYKSQVPLAFDGTRLCNSVTDIKYSETHLSADMFMPSCKRIFLSDFAKHFANTAEFWSEQTLKIML
jgi:hypothetical protein